MKLTKTMLKVAVCCIFGSVPAWTGCYDMAEKSDNSDSGSEGVDGETDADTDSDTDGNDTGSDADTDAEPNTVHQKPIVFQIINHTDEIVYLDGSSIVFAEFYRNGQWSNVHLEKPDCMVSCANLTDPTMCCILCEQETWVTAILPGDTITYTWDGLLYTMETATCDCGCYSAGLDPFAGEYKISISASTSTTCPKGDCPTPAESGPLYDRGSSGTGMPFETQIEIPYEGDDPVIEIEAVPACAAAGSRTTELCPEISGPTFDSICDGSAPLCIAECFLEVTTCEDVSCSFCETCDCDGDAFGSCYRSCSVALGP